MENYRLQPRDGMMIRITNAFVKANVKDDNGNIRTIWRNFSGVPTRNNPKGGSRDIVLDLNRKGNKDLPFLIEFGNDNPMIGWRPVTVDELIEMGWKVNIFDAREKGFEPNEGYVPSANLRVVIYEHDVAHRDRDPKIFQYIGNSVFNMVFHPNPMNQNEQPIEVLDDIWFDRVQIKLNHSDANTAYLDSMHIYPRMTARSYDDWAR